jgi:hypothetical protein
MPDIEFVPESVDTDAEDGLPGRLPRVPLRLIGILAIGIACAAAVVVTVRRPGPAPPSPRPTRVAIDFGSGFRPLLPGRTPVLDVAAVGASSWVLRRDAIFVVRAGRPRVRLALPVALSDPRLVADPGANLVWLVANGVARAYDGGTLRLRFRGWAPPCEDATAMDGQLFVTNNRDVVEVGPGLHVPRHIATTRGPIVAVTADPTRHRLIVAYVGAPSRVMSLVPQPHGPARIGRMARYNANQPTLAVAAGQIWLAGYSSANVLVRLDPTTLRPVAHTSLGSQFGLGAYLAGAGAYAVWVRGAGDGGELRCLNAVTGRQLQTWLISGRVASVASRAVVATGAGAVQLDLVGCTG